MKSDELALDIQEASGRKFLHPSHVVSLLENALNGQSKEAFASLLFTAKYITGLKKIVSQGSYTEDKYLEKMFAEFNRNVQEFLNKLDEILEDSESPASREMKKIYLKMDHESLARSLELAEDLSFCKEFFNRNEDRFDFRINS